MRNLLYRQNCDMEKGFTCCQNGVIMDGAPARTANTQKCQMSVKMLVRFQSSVLLGHYEEIRHSQTLIFYSGKK